MKKDRTVNWPEWNQQQLLAALHDLRALLNRAAGEEKIVQKKKPAATSAPSEFKSALDTLSEAFGLSEFERGILLLCAGIELDSQFAPLFARLNGEPRRVAPTFALALAVLPEAHWSALSPDAPLRRWRLIEISSSDSLASSALRIDERALHFLCGVNTLDERLRGLVQPCFSRGPLAPIHFEAAKIIRDIWSGPTPRPVIQLTGNSLADQRAVASAASASLGLRLYSMAAAELPKAVAEREAIARLWEREAIFNNAALLLETHDAEAADLNRAATFIDGVGSILLVAGREILPGTQSPQVRLDILRPPVVEQRAIWIEALGPKRAAALNGQIEAVAQQFQLDATAIREIVTTHGQSDSGALWNECRSRTRASLETLAQRIDARATWDDLVLPSAQVRTLREVAAHVRQRFRVYEHWGFAAKQSRGLGISALFSGPSGTGKTLAAEVLANELQLDLFRIDLSAVVNKYIGETEKNLRRLFDAAEASGAILLFDEADALFGKRSEVRDSHDRYANIEVGYLLQRMESYRGLAILTTNMKHTLDTAFLRRLRFVINFPFPDAPQRAEIWRRVFPEATPTEGIDATKLSRLNVAGGHIRNIALGAAVLAADSREPVQMKHLLQSARSECAKLERPPSEVELGGWA